MYGMRFVNMALFTTKFVQRASLFVSFGGLVTTFITTFLPLWKTMNSDLNEMENWYEGLWHMCIYTEEVGIHYTLASRVLMCISIATGFLGVAAAFFGLQGVEIGAARERMKRTLLILGGVFIVVSGITTLAPVSLMAYIMVVKFWDENLPDVMPRWEYGEAMFSAWFAGLLLVVGGAFLFVAVCMGDHEAKLQSKILARNQEQRPRAQHYRKTEII
uniref:Putative claudin-24 n=1 Tax=Sinocyclocheilus anshuiensis TaxID=1608454 RepID=A0A671R565_9TELE